MPKLTIEIDFKESINHEEKMIDLEFLEINEKSDVPICSEQMLPIILLLLEVVSKKCELRGVGNANQIKTTKKVRDFLNYLFIDSSISLNK